MEGISKIKHHGGSQKVLCFGRPADFQRIKRIQGILFMTNIYMHYISKQEAGMAILSIKRKK